MRTLLALAATAAYAAAQKSSLVWTQSEAYAVYTSAAMSRQAGGKSPTFATATWLNQPIFVEVFDSTTNGSALWSYTAQSNMATFEVDMARHSSSYFPPGTTSVVDTVALESDFGDFGSCTMMGWASTGPKAGAKPLWSYPIPECNGDLTMGNDYMEFVFSDNGAVAAASVYVNTSGTVQARLYAFDGQTGKLNFMYNAGAANQVRVTASSDGNWLAYVNEPNLYILNGKTGQVRGKLTLPYFIASGISDSGDFVVVGDEGKALVYVWSADVGAYSLQATLTPPSTQTWIPWDISCSTDDTEDEIVTIGWIDGEVTQMRATIYSLTTNQLQTDYISPQNAKLQTNAAIRTDMNYAAIATWGDQGGDVPTVILLRAGNSTPIFAYGTPGSMFAVDVVVDVSGATEDTVYIAAAGKAVPANQFGNGGNAYVWQVVVPK